MRTMAARGSASFLIGATAVMALTLAGADACVPGLAVSGALSGAGSSTMVESIDSDWWNAVQHDLIAREYEASWEPDGLQAPNRTQGFRARFGADGVAIGPRGAQRGADPGWGWCWQTTAWGRSGALQAAGQPTPHPDRARVEYRRDGLVEWYENSPQGLEQGFTVAKAPPGEGWLRIEGRVSGDLTARCRERTGAIDFVDEEGNRRFRYADLSAVDACGRVLRARLALHLAGDAAGIYDEVEGASVETIGTSDEDTDGAEIVGARGQPTDGDPNIMCATERTSTTIRIEVDDREAVYPIEIDPLMTGPVWEQHGIQDLEYFGLRLATAGDVNGDGFSDVVVAAPYYTEPAGISEIGRVEVYLGSPSGLALDPSWTKQGIGDDDPQLGLGVGTAGDVNGDGYDDLIVGMPGFTNWISRQGMVRVYLGSSSGLVASPVWTKVGDQASAGFGESVGTAGDVNGDGYDDVIVGASYYEDEYSAEGRAYVFLGTAAGIETNPVWIQDGNQRARFGYSVSTAGDVNADGYRDILVGAPLWDDGQSGEGAAFLFLGSPAGPELDAAWSCQANQHDAEMGNSVSTAGDTNGDGYADVVIGAQDFPAGGYDDAGAVFYYLGCANGLEPDPAEIFTGQDGNDRFGRWVDTAGDVNGDGYADVIVGAFHESEGAVHGGAARLFLGSPDGLGGPRWSLLGGELSEQLGACVATAGDVDGNGHSDVIIGAPAYATTGRALLFLGGGEGPAEQPGWIKESDQYMAFFGWSLAGGDANGDGFSDVLVGTPLYDHGQSNEGAAFVYAGSPTGPSLIPAWYCEGNQSDAMFGYDVAFAGDVDNNGYNDILVGARDYTGTYAAEGAAFLWLSESEFGSPGNPANADWRAFGGQEFADFGCSVASAGDVDGDGFSDIVIGARLYDRGQLNEGAAFVYFGSGVGPSLSADWFHDSGQVEAHYGDCVSSAGDFNGDGFSDVLIGAPQYNHPTAQEGLASIYIGSPEGPQTGAPYWYAQSDQEEAHLGLSVACAGDVNGDGCSDVIVGAPDFDAYGCWYEGGAFFVWHGSRAPIPSGDPENCDYHVLALTLDTYLGYAVSSAGDINGDGLSDIIVGAPGFDEPGPGTRDVGWVILVCGSHDGLSEFLSLPYGDQEAACLGFAVATAGDVNGDGFDDVLAGAPNYEHGHGMEGRAYLHYGNASRGLPRIPQQMRSDFSRPIGLLGKSDSQTLFGLQALGRTAAGRDRVRLEWEVKPYGTPFDGSDIVAGDWFDTGAPAPDGENGSAVALSDLVAGLSEDTQVHWRLRIAADNPFFPRTPWFSVPPCGWEEVQLRTRNAASALDRPLVSGDDLQLRIHPNPLSSLTTLTYSLPVRALVRLRIHDPGGRVMATLINDMQEAGVRRVNWNARNDEGYPLPCGVYWARLECGAEERTRRLLITR